MNKTIEVLKGKGFKNININRINQLMINVSIDYCSNKPISVIEALTIQANNIKTSAAVDIDQKELEEKIISREYLREIDKYNKAM